MRRKVPTSVERAARNVLSTCRVQPGGVAFIHPATTQLLEVCSVHMGNGVGTGRWAVSSLIEIPPRHDKEKGREGRGLHIGATYERREHRRGQVVCRVILR